MLLSGGESPEVSRRSKRTFQACRRAIASAITGSIGGPQHLGNLLHLARAALAVLQDAAKSCTQRSHVSASAAGEETSRVLVSAARERIC